MSAETDYPLLAHLALANPGNRQREAVLVLEEVTTLRAERDTLTAENAELIEAARAVVERFRAEQAEDSDLIQEARAELRSLRAAVARWAAGNHVPGLELADLVPSDGSWETEQ